MSPPVGESVFFQAPDSSFGAQFELGPIQNYNITGIPKGMQATTIIGGTFSRGGVNLPVDQLFFQLPNGSVTIYGHGTMVNWLSLGEVPLG